MTEWESITDDTGCDIFTGRLKIHGGWLVRCSQYFSSGSSQVTVALTFVPDPEHKWDLETKDSGVDKTI